MKANELRLNNLLFRTNKTTKERITLEVTASCIMDINGNGKNSSFIYEPIRLTEEWLIKFGFKSGTYNKSKCCPTFVIGKFKLLQSNSGNFYYKNQSINSVHQLQNMYFALTGKEL